MQNISAPDHFWKLKCRKSVRRCGAKYIWKLKFTKHTRSGPLLEVEMSQNYMPLWCKSKCAKHTIVGPLLEVQMSKKGTPLWHEVHFEIKIFEIPHVRATFGGSDVEKVHAVVARRTFRSKNVQNPRDSDQFWRFRCRFASLHYITGHYTTPHSSTLHYTKDRQIDS